MMQPCIKDLKPGFIGCDYYVVFTDVPTGSGAIADYLFYSSIKSESGVHLADFSMTKGADTLAMRLTQTQTSLIEKGEHNFDIIRTNMDGSNRVVIRKGKITFQTTITATTE